MCVNTKEEIINKIQQLLNHTEENGSSAAEAATAIAMAQKLMAKYGISIEEASVKEDTEIVENEVSVGTKSVSNYQWLLAKALSKHFACRVVKSVYLSGAQKITFIGEAYKVATIKECFLFAYNAYLKLSASFLRRSDSKGSAKVQLRSDYFHGFVDGLTNELIKSESENALVIVESEALRDHMSMMKLGSFSCSVRSVRSLEANEAGYKDGSYAFRNKNKSVTE